MWPKPAFGVCLFFVLPWVVLCGTSVASKPLWPWVECDPKDGGLWPVSPGPHHYILRDTLESLRLGTAHPHHVSYISPKCLILSTMCNVFLAGMDSLFWRTRFCPASVQFSTCPVDAGYAVSPQTTRRMGNNERESTVISKINSVTLRWVTPFIFKKVTPSPLAQALHSMGQVSKINLKPKNSWGKKN